MILVHVLRNSMIPVVTVIALGLPTTFAGAIITEQIFRINGVGALLIGAIEGADIPTVQTVTFIFAGLIVFFKPGRRPAVRHARPAHPAMINPKIATSRRCLYHGVHGPWRHRGTVPTDLAIRVHRLPSSSALRSDGAY